MGRKRERKKEREGRSEKGREGERGREGEGGRDGPILLIAFVLPIAMALLIFFHNTVNSFLPLPSLLPPMPPLFPLFLSFHPFLS